MSENVIKVGWDLDLDGYKAQTKEAEGIAEASGKKVGEAIGTGADAGASKWIGSIGKKLIALGSAVAAAFTVHAVISAADEADKSITKLNQSLINSGSFSAAAVGHFEDFASTMQKTKGIADDQALSMVALAKSFGLSNDKAEKMVNAATELAAVMGTDLNSAMMTLNGTLSGQAGRLEKQFPALKEFSSEALKAGAAIDYFNAKFTGTASGQLNNFAGAVKIASLSFSDIVKEIGFFITRSPVVIKAVQFIGEQFSHVAESLSGFRKNGVDLLGLFIVRVVDTARAIAGTFLPVLEILFNVGTVVFKGMATAVSTFATIVLTDFAAIANALAYFVPSMKGTADTVNMMLASSWDTTKQLMGETADAVANIGSTAGSTAAQNMIDSFATKIGDGSEKLRTSASLAGTEVQKGIDQSVNTLNWTGFVNAFKDASIAAKQTVVDLGKTVHQVMVTGLGNAFQAMGAALAKGENAFEAFGKAILGVFGDLAIQVGSFFLLQGIANLASLNPIGFAQIAGGLALITLGGALKALAGGGGGGSKPAEANASGTASTPGGDSFAKPETQLGEQKAEDRTKVQVNIQGNVLDRRQTGLEIAEAINEAFGSNGAVLARS